MAVAIHQIFPTEYRDTYYIPGNKRRVARGKLYQTYKTYREQLGAAGLINRRARRQRSATEDGGDSAIDKTSEKPVHTLETDTDPCSEVIRNWKKFCANHGTLQEDSLKEYFKHFPCLKVVSYISLSKKNIFVRG